EPGAWLGALTQPGMKSDQMQGLLAKSEPGAWLGALTQPGMKSEQIQGLLAKSEPGAWLGALTLDGAAQGVALVSAIEQAGDSQSMAAALMAAVSSGLGRSASTEKSTLSSNLFLANGLHSDLSLADALSKAFSEAVTNGAFGIVGSAQIGIVGSPRDRKLTGLGFAATESVDQTLASNLWLEQQSSSHNQKEPVHLAGTASTDEQRQRQLEQSDALLSPALPGSMSSFDGLQQAMSAQSLGRASFANANALEGTVSWLASQQGGSATIDLSPPELGSLRLELKIDAGGESAVLIVHAANDAAKAAIEQSLDRLYESFQSSGMSLQVSVGSGSSQFAGMFSNGFEERSKVVQEANRVAGGGRSGSISSPSSASGVASDALSLYA
ncbi:MAG: flagellar hook-length control protein FliK, partial [Betaproteobacteria bacterium]|nr:flagellar hook-length control protein FliK [Betaproteobacteria bacterium]